MKIEKIFSITYFEKKNFIYFYVLNSYLRLK